MENDSNKNKLAELVGKVGTGIGPLIKDSDQLNEYVKAYKDLQKKTANHEAELHAQLAALERQLTDQEKAFRRNLTEKDVELQRDRAQLHQQFAEREASLRQEIESQQRALQDRESSFRTQSDSLQKRTKALEAEHHRLLLVVKEQSEVHERAISDLTRQKEQFQADFQARMESKAAEYVDSALASLQASEQRFDWIGSAWSIAGLATVLLGLYLGYLLAVEGTREVVSNKDIGWQLILFFGAKGAVLLGLVFAVVRLCMNFARSYLHESLKNAERRHAINYGKFYLSVYGAGTDGEKVKDVFAHWNISGSSAFAEKSEPETVQAAAPNVEELAKAVASVIQKAAEGSAK